MTTPEKNTQDSVPGSMPGQAITGSAHSGEEAFGQRARELFLEASAHVDHVTAGKLRAARRTALDAAMSPPAHTARWLIPAGAFAAIALATLMVWQPRSVAPAAPAQDASVQTAESDIELPPDAEKTDPNLYQHMDFYKWLAANSAQGDAAAGQPVNR